MASIVVVDDEEDMTSMLSAILEMDGYAVTSASSGEMLLERLGLEPANPAAAVPDLIIMDVVMPGLDGYTLNMRLQGDERTRGIPVVVLTGRGQKMRELFELAPNVAAYVQKPVEPSALRNLVAGVLAAPRV
jgi:CheY-like chemotaxis protein